MPIFNNARKPESIRIVLVIATLFMLVLFVLTGCESPPSVSPLLRASSQAMANEIGYLKTDMTRDAEHMRQTRLAMDAAFDADLDAVSENNQLTADWIKDAMVVYVPAREALVRHEATLQHERRSRIDNLETAVEAQLRALQLLEHQNDLIRDTTHISIWRLLNLENPLLLETDS